MPKMLKSTTIIPSSLYVERAADRQLDRIIEDMGRPGYVLVARQMGKTNLLIHMKRRRETLGDVVVYFDLSTRFESARDLFRFVIDRIVESVDDLQREVLARIESQRKDVRAEANLEFDRHLRTILKALNGRRLIIVLDEIDSLISAVYSDSIFAQIRSMYFSRVNHPEYERLTYVLSGVADPIDLIKDKNISPFNIGEKIYLDDFSHDEFARLLDNAKVRFSTAVIQEIYAWTAGNPRLSWDLAAVLEDLGESGEQATRKDVIAAVEKLYLSRFDRAPVDHIRVLAESDPQIRSALISIRWGKGDSLDERSRARLYLAGIISDASGTPTVKNRIVDAALSDAWLAQASASQRSLLESAAEHFKEQRYDQAIQHIQDHIQIQPAGVELDVTHQFMLGMAYYNERRFELAISSLKKTIEQSSNSELTATCQYYLGSSYLQSGNVTEAVPILEHAVTTSGTLQNVARLSLTSALLRLDATGHFEKILSITESVVGELMAGRTLPAADDAELVASIYFNLGQANAATGRSGPAGEAFGSSLKYAPAKCHPAILIRTMRNDSGAPVSDAARKAAHVIMSERILLAPKTQNSLEFDETVLASVILKLNDESAFEELDQLVRYASDTLYAHARRPFAVLLHLALASNDDRAGLSPLARLALERYDDETVTSEQRFEAIRLAAQYTTGGQRERYVTVYAESLQDRYTKNISPSDDDFVVLINLSSELIVRGEHRRALNLINIGMEIAGFPDDDHWLFYVLLLRYRLDTLRSLEMLSEARATAKRLLEVTEAGAPKQLPDSEGFDLASMIESFRTFASKALQDHLIDPFRKIGRNQRVVVRDMETKRVRTVKFKFVERELRSGAYELEDIEANK
ncbi:AAA-like domain-containing protein [Bradyrhizobium sp. SYSU BS000235]|uniref:AAA-like domain-containing protein n=1 Tax=Bradyrhizobium sp. SYSU BS000235 TaxID=3411332 RepID=UPI003C74E993